MNSQGSHCCDEFQDPCLLFLMTPMRLVGKLDLTNDPEHRRWIVVWQKQGRKENVPGSTNLLSGQKKTERLSRIMGKVHFRRAGWGKAYRKNCSKFTKEPITAIIWRVPTVLSEVLSWKIAAAWRTEALNIFETACKLLEGLHYVAFFLTPPNSKGFFCCWYFRVFFGGVARVSQPCPGRRPGTHTGFALAANPSQFLKCRNYRTKSSRDQKEFCRNC